MNESKIKKKLQESIFKSLSSVPGVLSVTLVGSFIDKDDLTGISDIDTIVICKKLNEEVFKQCLFKAQSIALEACGLQGFKLKINSSFGPLKFDKPKLVVLHLMIYDIEMHRKHVLLSPFTCLDWERSKTFFGEKIRDIFPVGHLQPRDFFEARRGLENYMFDLKNGTISIREYDLEGERVTETKQNLPLDERHTGEYAYHIVRNLVMNGLKLKNHENRIYSERELSMGIGTLIKGDTLEHEKNFRKLSQMKNKRRTVFPLWTLEWATSFLKDYQKSHLDKWKNAKKIYFVRHARTRMNDKTFLGQGRNPGIIDSEISLSQKIKVEVSFFSNTRRCKETVKVIAPNSNFFPDERLNEINYGSIEGYTFEELKKKHPEIIKEWSKGNDPRFPGGGENTIDVHSRLKDFIKEINHHKFKSALVVTHNVVLRCLIGGAHGIAITDWHKLNIPHAEPLEFYLLNGEIFSNIPRLLLGDIFDNLREI